MKKLLMVLTLLLTLALLVACGGGEKAKDDQPDTPDTDVNTGEGSENGEGSETPDTPTAKIDIPFGFYNITNAKGNVLGAPESAKEDIKFDVVDTRYLKAEEANAWTVEPKIAEDGSVYYVLFCTYDPHHVAKPANLIPGKGLVRDYYDENNEAQQWILKKIDKDTFRIYNKKNEKFFLVTDEKGNPTLTVEEQFDAATMDPNWIFKEQTEFSEFITFYSEDRTVIFQLPKNTIKDAKIGAARIQQFVEDTVAMRKTYIEFTDFVTYDHIILKAYESEEHIAYVVSGYMCVSSDKDFIVADLKRMAERTTKHNVHDINFMMLHEMGHMFDRGRKWTFEGEAMTDIKAAYVLYKNPDCVAAPSEFESAKYFDYKTITEAYKHLGGSEMNGSNYSIYCCAAIFVDIIQNNIKDWDKVKAMYHWYQENNDKLDPVAWYKETNKLDDSTEVKENVARLDMYIAKLSEFGGVNVRKLIKDKDYQSMYKKCNGEA